VKECSSPKRSKRADPPAVIKRALVEAIDFGLLAPGEIVRETIYERIESRYRVRREEIPEKLETFHNALQELIGTGAKVIRQLIAKNLYNRLGLNFTEHDNWTLLDYVNHAKGQVMNDCAEMPLLHI